MAADMPEMQPHIQDEREFQKNFKSVVREARNIPKPGCPRCRKGRALVVRYG